MKKLTKEEKKFCEVYRQTSDLNQTKRKLGYEVDISKSKFRTYIDSIPILKEFEVTDDPILRNLYAIATFDHATMYDKDGDLKPLKVLTDEQRMALKSYKVWADDSITYTVHDKQKALDMLMKHKGLYKKDNEQSKTELQVGIVNITKDEIKKIDKVLESGC